MAVRKLNLGALGTAEDDKWEKLRRIQDSTYADMCNALSHYHICNVERPTGFGKTKMFMRYAAEHYARRMLYVYDVNSVVENIQEHYAPTNIDFISYSRLSMSNSQEQMVELLLSPVYDTIIFDESHLLGGEQIQQVALRVIPEIISSGRNVLGGTATPIRTDLVNVTERFFGNHRTYSYTLEDAFRDGIIIPPYWTAMIHLDKLLADLRSCCKKDSYQLNRLRQLDLAYAKLAGASKIYRDTIIQQFGEVPSYMKFIAFYPTIASLNDNVEDIKQDFRKAFPSHTVTTYAVSSDPDHFTSCAPLSGNETPNNHIDLILAVDMLNQSYHSSTLTGIIMNRATISNIVFTQQLGRCLSVTAINQAIVFDNVGNARVSPIEVLKMLQPHGLGSTNASLLVGRTRDHIDLSFHVSPEILDIAVWYSRIKATSMLTQEQVDYAKRVVMVYGATIEEAEEHTGVPAWVLNDEISM